MTITLLRNKQMLALVIMILVTALIITFFLLNAVAHINLFHTATALIFPRS